MADIGTVYCLRAPLTNNFPVKLPGRMDLGAEQIQRKTSLTLALVRVNSYNSLTCAFLTSVRELEVHSLSYFGSVEFVCIDAL